MASYEISTILKDVRIALDQNSSSEILLSENDIDTLTLEEIIESKIADAARIIESKAPSFLLDGGKTLEAANIIWDKEQGKGSGKIALPSNFMRLVCFKMSDWERSVTAAITDSSPEYELQHSRYPGLRGSPQRPIVAIVAGNTDNILEFYSCTGGTGVTITESRYIEIPTIKDNKIDICPKVYKAIIYYTAYLVANSIGHTDLATALLSISKEILTN